MNPSSSHRAYSVVCLVFLLLPMMGLSYVADSLHHAPSADITALRAYLNAEGIEVPENDEELKTLDSDGDGLSDFAEWVMGLDPLEGDPMPSTRLQSAQDPEAGIEIQMTLPDWFGRYVDILTRPVLIGGEWEEVENFLSTFGHSSLTWQDIARPNDPQRFYKLSDATKGYVWDYYTLKTGVQIIGIDPTLDTTNQDADWLLDWWELKFFGDLDQNGSMDFDGDGLTNAEEILWLGEQLVLLFSDPSMADSDNEGLTDYQERRTHLTNPLRADTDRDGRDDLLELYSYHTDPQNPDITPPQFISVL